MYSCTMPVPGGGGGGGGGWGGRKCPKFRALYDIASIYGNVLRWFGEVWGISMDRTTVMLTVK